jgi:hypothetical protein
LENDGAAENFISVQIIASQEKSILGLFGDSSHELNTKNLENYPVLLSILGLFGDSSPELNTKNLENSPVLLSILGLFKDSSPELNTKNLENSPVLLSVTYSVSSD